jgi:hypothetical protein
MNSENNMIDMIGYNKNKRINLKKNFTRYGFIPILSSLAGAYYLSSVASITPLGVSYGPVESL